jgi:hypothetical protein
VNFLLFLHLSENILRYVKSSFSFIAIPSG